MTSCDNLDFFFQETIDAIERFVAATQVPVVSPPCLLMDLVAGDFVCQLVELQVMVKPLVMSTNRRSKRKQVGFLVSSASDFDRFLPSCRLQ